MKLCKILNYNESTGTVVVKYEDKQVQFKTNTKIMDSVIPVKFCDGKYSIVDVSEYKKYIVTQNKQKRSTPDKKEKHKLETSEET